MSELALRTDVPASFEQQMKMAGVLAESTLLPAHLRGKPANVLIIIQGARAMGVSAFWALQSMFVVDGKLSMSAELMRALVIRAGHEFKIIEHTNKVAKVGIKRKGTDYWFETEFTMADAVMAKLDKKGPWIAYPSAMLLARVTSKICRAYCPDVLFGVVYTPEELGAKVDEEGAAVTNPDGSAVLDGEVVEVDQDMVDRIAELVVGDDLEAAANAYLTAMKLNIPEDYPGLKDVWIARLDAAIQSAKTKDQLGQIWRYANGTGALDHFGATIQAAVANLPEPTEAPAEPEVVAAAKASWDE